MSRVRDFIVGIDYDDYYDVNEDRGHMILRRMVTLNELISEIKQILTVGSYFPQFPPEALPRVTYAWDLSNQDDGDCYHEIMNKLNRHTSKEVNR
jgi:hypothetical protein